MAARGTLFWWRTAAVTAILAMLTGCQNGGAEVAPTVPAAEPGTLSAEERAELLKLARDTITTYLGEQRTLPYETSNPNFLQEGGAFVTLRKGGELRGCIGHMVSEAPIHQTVQEMAIAAATQDPRFPPVRLSEMEQITVEISLLSPLQRVTDTNQIVVGKHGLLIRHGWYQGVLLPQVAPEQGWDRQQFLEGLCYKAGLSRNAWQDPETELYWFTAEVFGEED